MRWAWALLLGGACLLASSVSADPDVSSPAPGQGLAQWTFSNPANYTIANATFGAGGAALDWTLASGTDSSDGDFLQATSRSNVDVTSTPGDVVLEDTSQPGPIQTLTFQPDPASLADNYLYAGNGGRPNFGLSEELRAGNWGGGEFTRSIVQFPALPLPANATIVGASLELYFLNPITSNPMDFSVHRVTNPWTELGSNWETRDGVILWNATGGDFDPAAADTAAGIASDPGWFAWNVTGLVRDWWIGAVPNQGLMVRQVADETATLGEKGFASSDGTNATLRPRLQIRFTTPSARGILASRVFDAGGRALWTSIGWTATVPAGTSLAIRTRSGDSVPVDASWSPWSAAYAASGAPIVSPPARYLQYELTLASGTGISPAVHDVTVAWGRYAAVGRVTTEPFGPASLEAWGNVTLDAMVPANTSVVLEISQDNGTSWVVVADGEDLSSRLLQAVQMRISLDTTNTTQTPIVRSLSLSYRATAGGLGTVFGGALAWWILALVLVGIGGYLAYVRLTAVPFEPVGLLVIHADGRLVERVGRGDVVRDELAASAMLTLVLQFVRDSFHDDAGEGGELKSLEVDDREVSIVKGAFLYMALLGEGTRPASLSARMVEFLRAVEAAHGPQLAKWDGLAESKGHLDEDLAWFLEKGYRRAHPGGRIGYHP